MFCLHVMICQIFSIYVISSDVSLMFNLINQRLESLYSEIEV